MSTQCFACLETGHVYKECPKNAKLTLSQRWEYESEELKKQSEGYGKALIAALKKMGSTEGKIFVCIPSEMGSHYFFKRNSSDDEPRSFQMNGDDWCNYTLKHSRSKNCHKFLSGYTQI